MKTVPRTGILAERSLDISSPKIHVVMNVLGTARTDVRVMRAANALVEAGFAVTVVDLEWQKRQPLEEHIGSVCVKHVVMLNWYTARRFKAWFLLRAVFVLMRSTWLLLRTSADIYHAHDTTGLPACYIAALLKRKPLIFDAHELPLSNEPGEARWYGLVAPFAKLLTIAVSRCAGVITVSPPIARVIQHRYGCAPVTLVRNVPSYQQVQRSDRLRQYLCVGPEVRIALYQGAIQVNRDLDKLVRAAPFLERDIIIVLMGPDPEGLQPQLEALVHELGVANRVKFVPPVPYIELLAWTSSADIGLIAYSPGRSQNVRLCLPNKLFEYLMVGLPVLVSQLDAVSELINTYDVGRVVPSLEPEEVGAAINAMLADRDECERMRHNALRAAQNDLCWEQESQTLVQLYRQILAIKSSNNTGEPSPLHSGKVGEEV
ncbi:MAG TPA: glycosyltransferase family 4 protein [Ktedonobacteraceae bacterium]|nr:glycosyltransferase family 4 protein [Ktedonobacteraceae bacterium]